MQQQLKVMLELQDAINTKVHPEWRQQQYQWYRAIWVECAELLDHYGWKWWKKQQPDVEQVQLELIDIWHFGLSLLLQSEADIEKLAASVAAELKIESGDPDFRLELESFTGDVLTSRDFSVEKFARLLSGIDMSFDQLYRGYVGKNVLNTFRQNNGYQDGTYQKQWAGKEDNEYLIEISNTLDADSADFKENLYQAMEEKYRQLTR